MSPSSYGPFQLELTANQRTRIRQLINQARSAGIGPSFIADLTAIVANLIDRPRDWGDPLHDLHSLDLTMFRGIHAKIAVTFAIHNRLPIVFLREIIPILDHPLAGA
jgi:hypothetical protein